MVNEGLPTLNIHVQLFFCSYGVCGYCRTKKTLQPILAIPAEFASHWITNATIRAFDPTFAVTREENAKKPL
jgi:hypothetical protein